MYGLVLIGLPGGWETAEYGVKMAEYAKVAPLVVAALESGTKRRRVEHNSPLSDTQEVCAIGVPF